ncbi:transcriptional regulator, RpiR family [Paenibacillus sp. yr247]|uniref:MurR/RpiR family transcriptional regulator n=1 Tax=Paenibacillus sp. yr247 TaxID=1761880 RepID=UPI0008832FFB|nr:MurR/RpiR family transcriptional regulator [Paenibacillus sp. yr247]SDO23511.1 transcriptional regulator, RpiR family [Paenibacillus sp. yr247]
MQFDERVQKFEYKLNDTDDQIIEYLLKNKKDSINMSIQALAAHLYTVPNTITRLSKKLGYDGFSQLKNSLKDELMRNEEPEVVTKGTPKDNLYYNIRQTLNLLDPEKMEIASKMLQQAERVLFFGVGNSIPFCEMMVKNLKITGTIAEFFIHRHEMIHEINHLKEQALVFFISLSGETPQVLEIAELCKSKGIQMISLTHFNRNSLQRLADVNLYCHSPKKMLNEYNITDKTPLMIVIRVFSEYYWNMNEHDK